MHDIAAFLRARPPFNSLDDETLARVADSVEIEFFAARSPILASTDAVAECGYVVRCGSVELVVDGRLLALVGEGEVFGFASIVSGDSVGFVARAAEDTLVYRIPADEMRAVLDGPDFVRFITHVPVTRTALKEAFRTVARIQRAIEARLGLRAR
jgi:CBS domain-containing protein